MKCPFEVDEIVSYRDMCGFEGMSLQAGMNFREDDSIFLMSRRKGAPYTDAFDHGSNRLIYEGHDEPRRHGGPSPKTMHQPLTARTANKRFFDAATELVSGIRKRPLSVRVYEKLKSGIWVFNGTFALEEGWVEEIDGRNVIKFGLTLIAAKVYEEADASVVNLEVSRVIPSAVKQIVYKRDGGCCVLCQSKTNLHFDHELPFSRGGTSLLAENIRLLCATHNLKKGARIE